LLQKPDQIMTGAKLSPNQLSSMGQVARQLFAGADQRRRDAADYYRGLAQRSGIPVEDVLPMMLQRGAGGGETLSPAERAELEQLRAEYPGQRGGR